MSFTQSQLAAAAQDRHRLRHSTGHSLQPSAGRRAVEGAARQGRGDVPGREEARLRLRPRVSAAPSTCRTHPREEDLFHRVDEVLPRAPEEVRPGAVVRRVAHGRAGAEAGGRSATRRSRPASIAGRCTASLGRERSDRPTPATRRPGARGTSRSRTSTPRRPRPSGWTRPARCSSPRSTLGALALRRRLVRRHDTKPVEHQAGQQRLFGRDGELQSRPGLVGFGIGSETHGSIVSPSTRCGVTGLRPTFGRVSRARVHDAVLVARQARSDGAHASRTVHSCSARSTVPIGKDPAAVRSPLQLARGRDR